MAVRIQSQAEMRRATDAVLFCYLCGCTIEGQPKQALIKEHVLAKGTLHDGVSPNERWPVCLRVHEKCEREQKRRHDADLVAAQRANTWRLDKMSPQDRAAMRGHIASAEADGVPMEVPAFSAEGMLRAIWATVRGMHAVLYRCALPADAKHLVLAPVPGV